MKKGLIASVVLCLCLFLGGCHRMPEPGPGGLNAGDFVQVALNGFDAADQALDHNDYPWSMEVYQADTEGAQSFLYVGTWNRVQQWKGFQDHKPVYPEIRRYRPEISPTTWERVLDTRDLDLSDSDRPHGFRIMKEYRNASDGVKYLYAGGRGDKTTVWRSRTGEPGSWELFYTYNREGSIRSMVIHKGLLYMNYLNDYGLLEDDGGPKNVIFATDGQDVEIVSDDGFGNKNNKGIFAIRSFNGYLYAGTHNPLQGAEVWKLDGPDPNEPPKRVIAHGGPRRLNEAAMTMYEWQDHLYVGTVANHILRMIGGLKPCDLLRIDKNDEWQTVAGPCSIGGERSGFGEKGNSYMWSMCEHNGWFYVGTYDIVTGLTYMLTHPRYLLGMMGIYLGGEKCLTGLQLIFEQGNSGGDLYKTQDGATWYCVTANGLGNHNNYGVRTMRSFEGRLFLGLSNPYDGLEVWASEAGLAR